jgi:penicillin-binding protein 2
MKPNITNPHLDEDIKSKSRYLIAFVFVLLGILTLRLFVMQIINGSYYEGLSRNNRIRIISVPAPRGKIFDRDGVVVADNRPAFNVMVLPEDISDPKNISMRLAPLLDKPASEILQAILKGKSKPYDPLVVARDITFNQVAKVEMEVFNLPGVSIETIPEREYLFGSLGCHALGYIGEISKRQLEEKEGQDYAPGDLIGKSGIELVSEGTLRGTKGKRVFEVDARGQRVRVLDEKEPIPGHDVKLTLDQDLQAIARQGLGDKAGAVVAMVPSTGEVLIMESTPGFDPSIFAVSMLPQQWKDIIGDPMHPLENRAMRGAYPPGSVFKIVVTLAGFHAGILDPNARVFCPGHFNLGRVVFKCWKPEGHGSVDLVEGIVRSCDVYFYTLGRALGIDAIAEVGFRLGLGARTGILLPDESPGLMPTKAWKRKRFGQPWHPGEHVIAAIGQGYTLVTPIQMAKAMSAVVNGGRLYTPRIIAADKPVLERDLGIPGRQIDLIKAGLKGVVEDAHGTAHSLWDKEISMGGKTGTAQVARGYVSKLPDESDIPYKLRDHAWFFGFSPVEKPEIVVVALVEHGGHGGAVSGPIVRDVIKGYYLLKEGMREQVRQDN